MRWGEVGEALRGIGLDALSQIDRAVSRNSGDSLSQSGLTNCLLVAYGYIADAGAVVIIQIITTLLSYGGSSGVSGGRTVRSAPAVLFAMWCVSAPSDVGVGARRASDRYSLAFE